MTRKIATIDSVMSSLPCLLTVMAHLSHTVRGSLLPSTRWCNRPYVMVEPIKQANVFVLQMSRGRERSLSTMTMALSPERCCLAGC